jgi:hypothetical protein
MMPCAEVNDDGEEAASRVHGGRDGKVLPADAHTHRGNTMALKKHLELFCLLALHEIMSQLMQYLQR